VGHPNPVASTGTILPDRVQEEKDMVDIAENPLIKIVRGAGGARRPRPGWWPVSLQPDTRNIPML
jgi:hypothetical protein